MTKEEVISKTAEYVNQKLLGESSGHDWWHILRVWNNAKHILKAETGVDSFVVELAALLHDIADWKFNGGDETAGAVIARDWLLELGVEQKVADHVYKIIATSSFKGAAVDIPMETLEGKIVQDADRLDALGAVGIGRTFAYGGNRGREMYNPEVKPQLHDSAQKYMMNTSPTINHFYEKLLLLADRMNTKTARKIAKHRHKYMEVFLDEFFKEWNGTA